MKIGILTLHSGYNEGAILQAYCLAKHLERQLDAQVEIVDHRYKAKAEQTYGKRDQNSRTKTLADFIDNTLPLSPRQFYTDTHQQTFDYIKERYDGIVVGSDEVLKLKYTRRFFGLLTTQTHPSFPAFPNVYWPTESLSMPRFTYAASVGKTKWQYIPDKDRRHMAAILQGFALIGVRDQRTFDFLEWISPDVVAKAKKVPDPTFAYDVFGQVDQDALQAKLEGLGVDFSRPRLGILLRESTLANDVIAEFKRQGYQILALSERNIAADIHLFDHAFTPFEWGAIMGLLDGCVSQRMHGCIYCLLNNTPVVAMDYSKRRPDSCSKLNDLMSDFGLDEYYVSVTETHSNMPADVYHKLQPDNWPMESVAENLKAYRQKSVDFAIKMKIHLK